MDQSNYSMIVDEACDVEVCDEDVMSSSEKENVDINETNELSFGLEAVFDDMNERLKENDPNYVSGVAKFLKSYRSLQEKTISTPSIASALHTFGMEGQWSYTVFCNYNLNVLQLVYREGTKEYWYQFRQLLPPDVEREYQEAENPSLKVVLLN